MLRFESGVLASYQCTVLGEQGLLSTAEPFFRIVGTVGECSASDTNLYNPVAKLNYSTKHQNSTRMYFVLCVRLVSTCFDARDSHHNTTGEIIIDGNFSGGGAVYTKEHPTGQPLVPPENCGFIR